MNLFKEEEFKELCNTLKVEEYSEEITIRFFKSNFFNKIKKTVEKDRRGEVVFCVIRPNNKVITITCRDYPSGVFRIPTGGIGHEEDIIEAVYRETKEELGLEVELVKFIGVLKIRFEYKESCENFFSYLFILREKGGNLLLDATDDEVSEVLEADLEKFKNIVENLNNIKGKWSDWGKFRYATSNAILKYLLKKEEIII